MKEFILSVFIFASEGTFLLFELVNIFWTPNKKSYIGLAQMYQEYSDFRVFYSNYHTDLVEFLTDAMFTFAQNSLK